MRWLKAARAIGGLLTIVTLLGLVVADFLRESLHLQPSTIFILISIIGGLLAVDRLVEERLPVTIQIGQDEPGGDGEGTPGHSPGDDDNGDD